ncbi:MAG: hypothetical protein ACJAXH_000253 [Colwellia sp.]|jgi:hypothetical protein
MSVVYDNLVIIRTPQYSSKFSKVNAKKAYYQYINSFFN